MRIERIADFSAPSACSLGNPPYPKVTLCFFDPIYERIFLGVLLGWAGVWILCGVMWWWWWWFSGHLFHASPEENWDICTDINFRAAEICDLRLCLATNLFKGSTSTHMAGWMRFISSYIHTCVSNTLRSLALWTCLCVYVIARVAFLGLLECIRAMLLRAVVKVPPLVLPSFGTNQSEAPAELKASRRTVPGFLCFGATSSQLRLSHIYTLVAHRYRRHGATVFSVVWVCARWTISS